MTICSSNIACLQGECCQADSTSPNYFTCTSSPSQCVSSNQANALFQACHTNSQCVTKCCHSSFQYCISTSNASLCKNSQEDALAGWAIAVIIVVSLVLLLFVVLMIFCIRRWKQSASSSSLPVRRSAKIRPAYPSSVSSGGSMIKLCQQNDTTKGQRHSRYASEVSLPEEIPKTTKAACRYEKGGITTLDHHVNQA